MILQLSASPIYPVLPKPKSPDDFEKWDREFTKYMKPYNDLEDELMDSKKYDFGSRMFMNLGHSESEQFYYFLNKSKALNGHKFYFYPKLEKGEEKFVYAYIMEPTQGVPEKYWCNDFQNYNSVFLNINSKYPVKAIKELRLRKFTTIKNNTIYYDNTFIISQALMQKFNRKNFTGLQLNPIKNCSNKKAYENMYSILPDSILPSSCVNILRSDWQDPKNPDNKALLYEGTLIYTKDALSKLKSFNYPCEATKRDSTADIIVSKEFKEFCESEKIKGIDFIPIFTKESKLFEEYVGLVKKLCNNLIESNPKHVIGYSKIDPQDILDKL